MKALNYLRKRNYQLWLEKLVVGVEEPIFIKGVGDILAKVDSGNGAFNVIHGEDFYYQGDVVVFTTYDENGKDHRVSKKVQDTITINIGAGQTEDRPVVLFDVKFATDEFLNVPFTVGNRSNNKNKVLLGQEFLKNELDALIDISQDNISDKKIEVDYTLKEEDTSTAMHGGNNFLPKSLKTNPSGATSTAAKAYQAAKGGIRGAYNIYKTLGNTNLTIGQGIDTLKKNWAEAKREIQDYQKDDKYLIFKYLNDKFMASGQPISPFVKDPQVYKILDYIGYTYENKQIGNKQNNSQDQPQNQDQNQEQNPEQQQSDSTEIVNSSYQENSFNLIKEETTFEKTQREQASINKPILYLVLFNNDQKENFKIFLRDNYPQAETDFDKIMSDIKSDFYSDTTKRLGRMLVDGLKSKGILTEFVLVSGVKGSRKVTPIAEAFEKSIFTEFLGERVINYIEELLTNSELSSVDEQGNFSSNPQFGFKKYRAVNGSTIATEGPVDSQIKRWIDSNKGGENPNIFAAFQKFNNYGTQNDKTSENKGEDDSFGKTEGGTPPPQPESPNQGTEFEGEDARATDRENYSSEKQSQASQDTKRLSDSSKKQRKTKQKTTKKEKYPKKAPDGFMPPKKSKRLNNGHYLWKDSTSGRFLEYDPETGIIYDALEWRRQRGQEENEENLLETTCSEFILNILFE